MLSKWIDRLVTLNTLYYPGCVTHCALPEIQARYEALLREVGVDFIVLDGETLCCGSPVKRAGYASDFDDLKAKNLEIFSRFSVGKIITNCPGCYHTLQQDYGMEVHHASQVLAERVQRLQPKELPIEKYGEITYHDPCHLGRWSGIFDEPRNLLADSGWDVAELPDNRQQSLCCGAGGGLKSNHPELADAIAQQRLAQVQGDHLCTACPLCYAHFKQNAVGMTVLEFSEALNFGEEGGGS